MNTNDTLRELLRDIGDYFKGPRIVGGPLSELRNRIDAALAEPVSGGVAPFSKGFTTLETGNGKYRVVTSYQNRDDAWADYTALNGGAVAECCPTCGADEPYTGNCGTSDSDTRALCKCATRPEAKP